MQKGKNSRKVKSKEGNVRKVKCKVRESAIRERAINANTRLGACGRKMNLKGHLLEEQLMKVQKETC